MNTSLFLKGLVIGLSIAAPVGPIGILCIRRSLEDGMLTGFMAGLGAATADAAYGCVASFGLTAVSDFLIRQKSWIGLVGGGFLCYLGLMAFLTKPSVTPATDKAGSNLAVYGSTLILTLANPATILSFAAVFAAIGVGTALGYRAASSLVAGVFLGSALWWFALSSGVSLVRHRVNTSWMIAINRVSGAVLLIFGLYALLRI